MRITQRKVTTIQLDEETRERLSLIGCKGETYDQIIRRLLKRKSEELP